MIKVLSGLKHFVYPLEKKRTGLTVACLLWCGKLQLNLIIQISIFARESPEHSIIVNKKCLLLQKEAVWLTWQMTSHIHFHNLLAYMQKHHFTKAYSWTTFKNGILLVLFSNRVLLQNAWCDGSEVFSQWKPEHRLVYRWNCGQGCSSHASSFWRLWPEMCTKYITLHVPYIFNLYAVKVVVVSQINLL